MLYAKINGKKRRSGKMDLPIILMGIGILLIAVSFFIKGDTRRALDEIENVSLSLHRETNVLKKRILAIEEELMITGTRPTVKSKKQQPKPVHEIIVNQILSLQSQGFTVAEIAKRSSLTNHEVIEVLRMKGIRV